MDIDGSKGAEWKVGVLRHLRVLLHATAGTGVRLPLELTFVAAHLGISEQQVKGTIEELVLLEYVRPIDKNAPHLAVADGRCWITAEGLHYLNDWETLAAEKKWGPVGFTPGTIAAVRSKDD